MKKTILTAMLFFAFLVIGIQSASAQYVNTDTASDLLEAEIQAVQNHPDFDAQNKDASSPYLLNKLNLFSFVNERIENGSTVEDAIQLGVMILPSNDQSTGAWVTVRPLNEKNPTLSPLHQELEDLLNQ